jgi:hypothetical protein
MLRPDLPNPSFSADDRSSRIPPGKTDCTKLSAGLCSVRGMRAIVGGALEAIIAQASNSANSYPATLFGLGFLFLGVVGVLIQARKALNMIWFGKGDKDQGKSKRRVVTRRAFCYRLWSSSMPG